MLQEALDDIRVIRIFRYVDDFLIMLNLNPNDKLLYVVLPITLWQFLKTARRTKFHVRDTPPRVTPLGFWISH